MVGLVTLRVLSVLDYMLYEGREREYLMWQGLSNIEQEKLESMQTGEEG